MRLDQPVEDSLQNLVKDAIVMPHGVDVRLVHQNSTGQPWAKPGQGDLL
jgi:hypothetical protein